MIRSSFSKVLRLLFWLSLSSSLTGCTSSLDEASITNTDALHEVTVTLSGINFNLAPTRATASDAGITHIALKVFNTDGTEAASVTQTSSSAGTDFNKLKLQLPAGTYTFVAVAHSATADNVACATITSASEATLPEAVVPTLYCHVQNVLVSTTTSTQALSIDMGKRINATIRLTSTDNVPDDVSRMAVDLNPQGSTLGASNLPQINPSTGFSIGNYRFARALPVTAGQPIDVSFNLLLPEDTYSFPVTIHAQDASNKTITDYDRSFDDVPFLRASITNASGTFFRYVNSSSLTFDTTIETLDFDF